MLLLAVASSAAMGEWAKLMASQSEANTIYADSATIRRTGNKAKMWGLVDHQTAVTDSFGKSHVSERVHREYDCKDEQERILAYVTYSENMGKGKTIYGDSGPGKWRPVAPDTAEKSLWKIACGKK